MTIPYRTRYASSRGAGIFFGSLAGTLNPADCELGSEDGQDFPAEEVAVRGLVPVEPAGKGHPPDPGALRESGQGERPTAGAVGVERGGEDPGEERDGRGHCSSLYRARHPVKPRTLAPLPLLTPAQTCYGVSEQSKQRHAPDQSSPTLTSCSQANCNDALDAPNPCHCVRQLPPSFVPFSQQSSLSGSQSTVQ